MSVDYFVVLCSESFGVTFGIIAAIKVTYSNQKKVLITNKDAIEAGSYDGNLPDFVIGHPDQAIDAAKHVVGWCAARSFIDSTIY